MLKGLAAVEPFALRDRQQSSFIWKIKRLLVSWWGGSRNQVKEEEGKGEEEEEEEAEDKKHNLNSKQAKFKYNWGSRVMIEATVIKL